MTRNLSDLYDVTKKRNIESKGKEGFIRPTLGEHFSLDKYNLMLILN